MVKTAKEFKELVRKSIEGDIPKQKKKPVRKVVVKEVKKSFDEKKFYDKYKGKLLCVYEKDIKIDKDGVERSYAKTTQEREKYIFNGLKDDMVLIRSPKDALVIEFETHDKKGEQTVEKDKLKEWVKQTYENAQDHNIDSCIVSHGGTSDYFYAFNFEKLIENKEAECKKEIVKLIVPNEAIDFVDESNLGDTLIPIINRPHWKKKKYKGAIHKIIEGLNPDKHKNKIPDIVMQRVLDNERPNFPKVKNYGGDDINSISLSSVISTSGLKKKGNEYQGENVWHGSSTGMNFCVNTLKNAWICFRCNAGGGVAKAIALNKGIISSCGDDLSADQFKQVLQIAREDYGLKKPEPKKNIKPNEDEMKIAENSLLKDLSEHKEKEFYRARVSGKLRNGKLYWTMPVFYLGKWQFMVVTEDKKPMFVINNGALLQGKKNKRIAEAKTKEEKEEIKSEEIPEEGKYLFFEYENVRYKYPDELFYKDSFNINIPSKNIFKLMKEKVDKKKLWEDLLKNLKGCFDHSNPSQYNLILPAVITSYIHWGLGSTYYVIIKGKEDTGKSTLQKWLSLVQMNGWFGGKASVAVATRYLHFFGISMNQEEIEKMGKEEKVVFTGVANSGFDVNGTYNFVNTNKRNIADQIVSLNTFGIKSFSSNADILEREFDKSFISRCDVIIGTRKNRETKDLRKLSELDLNNFQDLRDRLFVYCLSNFNEIEKDIEETKTTLEKEGDFGRSSDVKGIILGIIKHFKGDYTKEKEELLGKESVDRMEGLNTKESLSFKFIADIFKQKVKESKKSVTLSNADIRNFLNNELNLPDGRKIAARTIGAILRNFQLITRKDQIKREGDGYHYTIFLKDFQDMLGRYKFKEIQEILQKEDKNKNFEKKNEDVECTTLSSFSSLRSLRSGQNEANELNERNELEVEQPDRENNFAETKKNQERIPTSHELAQKNKIDFSKTGIKENLQNG
jgi:hypothetical protein